MSTSHTPGPWVALPFGPDGGARAYGPACHPVPDTWENASLIAAAPELLAALRWIAMTPKEGEPELGGWTFPDEPPCLQSWDDDLGVSAIEALHNLIDEARAAIAKAEGRS